MTFSSFLIIQLLMMLSAWLLYDVYLDHFQVEPRAYRSVTLQASDHILRASGIVMTTTHTPPTVMNADQLLMDDVGYSSLYTVTIVQDNVMLETSEAHLSAGSMDLPHVVNVFAVDDAWRLTARNVTVKQLAPLLLQSPDSVQYVGKDLVARGMSFVFDSRIDKLVLNEAYIRMEDHAQYF